MTLSAVWHKLCECFALSEYEARVYVSLIEAGVAKATTLSLMSGVPRTKVYNVLRKLITMGLVVEIPEEPRKFAPTPPKTAFRSYLRLHQSMTENILSLVTSLDETFRIAKNDRMPQQGTMWIINGQEEIFRKIHEILSMAKSSVDLVANGNEIIHLYKSFNRILDEITERSVKVRIKTHLNSTNQKVIYELRYTCKVEEIDYHSPLIFLSIDNRQFLLACLQPTDSCSSLNLHRCIFSDNPVLREMIDLLIPRKIDMALRSSTL